MCALLKSNVKMLTNFFKVTFNYLFVIIKIICSEFPPEIFRDTGAVIYPLVHKITYSLPFIKKVTPFFTPQLKKKKRAFSPFWH